MTEVAAVPVDIPNSRSGDQPTSSTWRQISEFSARGHTDNHLVSVTGMCWLPDGDLAIVDQINSCVKIFTAEGTLLDEFGQRQLVRPCDVASAGGGLVVTDSRLGCIREFSKHGKLQATLRKPCRQPHGVSCTDTALVVSDLGEKCVFWLPRKGGPLDVDCLHANALDCGFRDPKYVSCINNGDVIIVTDSRGHSVKCISKTGEILMASSQHSSRMEAWEGPAGITALPGGSVLVCDMWNNRIKSVNSKNDQQVVIPAGVVQAPVVLAFEPALQRLAVAEAESDTIKLFACSSKI